MGEGLDGVLDAAQAGAGWASEVLYRDLAPAVAGYLRVQGAADPDDLTNEVFLRVFRDLESFSGSDGQFRLVGVLDRACSSDRRTSPPATPCRGVRRRPVRGGRPGPL